MQLIAIGFCVMGKIQLIVFQQVGDDYDG